MPTQQEFKVLKLLAKEWEHSGPPGILDISDIITALNLAPSETLQALKTLYQNGLVDIECAQIQRISDTRGLCGRRNRMNTSAGLLTCRGKPRR
jgi:Mn-dependent DtxR family transcriptional regulator